MAERRGGGAAGVAEQDVEPAQLAGDPLHHPLRLGGNPDIRHQRHDGAAPLGLELLGPAPGGGPVTAACGGARPPPYPSPRPRAAPALPTAPPPPPAARRTP